MILKTISYNLYFESYELARRMDYLFQIIHIHSPDIVCLQEVTPLTLSLIKKFMHGYFLYPSSMEKSYGNIILSKLPITHHATTPLKSMMERDIHTIQIEIEDSQPLSIGTFHLESDFMRSSIKLEQFKELFRIHDQNNVILMGDTNIVDREEKLFEIPEPWQDLYIALERPVDCDFTYDGLKNPLAPSEFQNRFDRIYFKGEVYPMSMKLIGTKPLNGIVPSDHFGILALFEIGGE